MQQEILDLRVDDLYNYIVEHRKAEIYEHEVKKELLIDISI